MLGICQIVLINFLCFGVFMLILCLFYLLGAFKFDLFLWLVTKSIMLGLNEP